MDKTKFAALVAARRKAKGLTQKQLADRLHVSDKAVSKWERALSLPDIELLEPAGRRAGRDGDRTFAGRTAVAGDRPAAE